MEENSSTSRKAGGRTGGLADLVAENLGADRYGADRNHVNLDEALRYSREYVSPVDVGRAEDGIDGEWDRESAFSRDLSGNIEKNRERREAGYARLSDADRDAKIDYYIASFEVFQQKEKPQAHLRQNLLINRLHKEEAQPGEHA